jgi:hypothetical protein
MTRHSPTCPISPSRTRPSLSNRLRVLRIDAVSPIRSLRRPEFHLGLSALSAVSSQWVTTVEQVNPARIASVAPTGPRHTVGVIAVGDIYTIDEAKARLRWTDSALRAAKRRGLQLLICGKRRYVTGEEILRFLVSTQKPKLPK